MIRSAICCFALIIPVGLAAQAPVADGVSDFLGGGAQVAWFERGGTVWRTDGTARGTFDTGAVVGNHSEPSDRLVVYGTVRIDWLGPDGSSTALTPPIAFAGFDEDASSPTIWRPLLSTGDAEFIELWNWSPSGWSSRVSGVQGDPGDGGQIVHRVLRNGRYLVSWEGPSLASTVTDLFGRLQLHLTAFGATPGMVPAPWSRGLAYGGDGVPTGDRDAIYWVHDDGRSGRADLPTAWQWGPQDWSVHEPSPGFPFARWRQGPEFVAFLTDDEGVIAEPPGVHDALLWVGRRATVLARTRQGGLAEVLWFDRSTATWRPTGGFGAATTLRHLGEFEDQAVLAIQRSAGAALVRFDDATQQAVTLVAGLAAIVGPSHPFAGGFLFAADDGVHGLEPWYSDGSAAGTRMLADLAEGTAASAPGDWHTLGPSVVFTTGSGSLQRLWSVHPMHLDWVRSPVNGHHYRVTAPTAWPDAERTARNLGGSLATIRSQREQDWIWSAFGGRDLWIGLEDRDRNGAFGWASGEPLGFTAWCPGEPSGPVARETAVHLAQDPGLCEGGWNDQTPSDRYPAVVERDQAPAAVEPFGEGCVRQPGQPQARADWTGGWPRPGGIVDIRFVFGTGSFLHGAVLLGFDATRFGGLELPVDLGFAGAPDCALRVAVDDTVLLGDVVYEARFLLRVPASQALTGATVFVQGLTFNPVGQEVSTTNGLRVTVTH
jgi:ELWxxDGT repeat protein